MPGNGLVPARGEWQTRWFETASAATFAKGSLVNFDDAYRLKEYASTDSAYVGIAQSYSTQSTLMRGLNMVAVSVPGYGATAYSDVTTGVTASDASIGKKVCVYKQGNLMSYASTLIGHASRFSGIAQIVGPISTADSRAEIALLAEGAAFYSTSSTTFAS